MKELFIPTKKNSYKPYLLKKGVLVIYTVILVVVNIFGGVLGISPISASDINSVTLISLTNQERLADGLNELNTNSKLTAAAQAKAENMFEEQYWDHYGPNGETPWQFITATGYYYVYAGENLAKGFRTSEGVVEAWMASPKHRDNILSENYQDIGIAVKTGVLLGKETTLVVQMFGNLTAEVYGSTSEQSSEPEEETPVTTSPVIETGEIKAISITYPKTGDIFNDASILIQGEVEGDKDEYTVQVYDSGESFAQIDGDEETWEYSSEEKWDEGEHSLEAQVKGTDVMSDDVSFEIDTIAPTVIQESISVIHEEDNFTISFETDEDWYEIIITSGDEERSFLKEETEDIVLEVFEPSDQVILTISDQAGNSSESDITEYFLKGDTEEYNNFSLSLLIDNIKSTEGVNIILVGFILILLAVEVYVLWKKKKLGQNVGDLFVLALWVTILTIGLFKGFGGISG